MEVLKATSKLKTSEWMILGDQNINWIQGEANLLALYERIRLLVVPKNVARNLLEILLFQ